MTKLIAKPGIPGIDLPFKCPNPNFPPLEEVLSLVKSPLLRNMASPHNNVDCLEIANKIYSQVHIGSIIYFAHTDFTWPERMSNFGPGKFKTEILVPENRMGKICGTHYYYHAVYSDGRYIYDPALSTEAIVKSDYFKLIRGLNTGHISSRSSLRGSPFFHKS